MSLSTDSGATHPMLSHTDRLAAQAGDFLLLVGRVVMGWMFVMYGWQKFFTLADYAATFPRRGLSTWMAYIAVPVEFFLGLALLLGFATRYAAVVMLIFLVVASFSSHAYWSVPEAQRANQMAHFWKNITIMGGMVLLFITGAGRYSVDAWLAKKR